VRQFESGLVGDFAIFSVGFLAGDARTFQNYLDTLLERFRTFAVFAVGL
jgi:hypothetical protein